MGKTQGWAWMGCIAMALAVGAGAFGAHGLKESVTPERMEVWRTAARYHAYHALALIALELLQAHVKGRPGFKLAGILFLAGLVIFSGSLYLLVLTDQGWLGAITPIGGVAWIVAWSTLAVALLRTREVVE